jgi:hypothetical protein
MHALSADAGHARPAMAGQHSMRPLRHVFGQVASNSSLETQAFALTVR